jgi:hypothetical protein
MTTTQTDPVFETLEVSLECSRCGFHAGWKGGVYDGLDFGDDERARKVAAERIDQLWETALLHHRETGDYPVVRQNSIAHTAPLLK